MLHDDAETIAEDLRKTAFTNRVLIQAMSYVLDDLTERLIEHTDTEPETIRIEAQKSLERAIEDAREQHPEEANRVNLSEALDQK
mgnify:CR=1 FL=1